MRIRNRGVAWGLLTLLLLTSCRDTPPGETIVGVTLTTELGAIELELYPDRAPLSVANFLRYIDQQLFDGASFYRVVREDNDGSAEPIQVVQGGLMGDTFRYGTMDAIDSEIPGLAPIAHETTTLTGLRNRYGVVALARLDPGTATSEFFINMADNPSLDTVTKTDEDRSETARDGAGYATFGRITGGMEILEAIQDGLTGAPKRASADLAVQVLDTPVVITTGRRR